MRSRFLSRWDKKAYFADEKWPQKTFLSFFLKRGNLIEKFCFDKHGFSKALIVTLTKNHVKVIRKVLFRLHYYYRWRKIISN